MDQSCVEYDPRHEVLVHNGLFKITKKMIQNINRYPTLDKKETMGSLILEEVEPKTGTKWNGRGFSISKISNTLIEFVVGVISHIFYQSRILNNVPCMAVDQACKIAMTYHEYDLTELKRVQVVENLIAIKRLNNSMCNFG